MTPEEKKAAETAEAEAKAKKEQADADFEAEIADLSDEEKDRCLVDETYRIDRKNRQSKASNIWWNVFEKIQIVLRLGVEILQKNSSEGDDVSLISNL